MFEKLIKFFGRSFQPTGFHISKQSSPEAALQKHHTPPSRHLPSPNYHYEKVGQTHHNPSLNNHKTAPRGASDSTKTQSPAASNATHNPGVTTSKPATSLNSIIKGYERDGTFINEDGEVFELGNVLANGLAIPIGFDYPGSTKQRHIILQQIIGYDWREKTEADCGYITGFCSDKNEPRTFRVDKINTITLLETGKSHHDPELLLTRIVFEWRGQLLKKITRHENITISTDKMLSFDYKDPDSYDDKPPAHFEMNPSEFQDYRGRKSIKGRATRDKDDNHQRRWTGHKTFFLEQMKNITCGREEVKEINQWLQQQGVALNKQADYPPLEISGITHLPPNMNVLDWAKQKL